MRGKVNIEQSITRPSFFHFFRVMGQPWVREYTLLQSAETRPYIYRTAV